MRFVWLFVVYGFAVAALSACKHDLSLAIPKGVIDYDVYSAIINEGCHSQSLPGLAFVRDKTTDPWIQNWSNARLLERYDGNNRTNLPLTDRQAWQEFVAQLDSSQFSIQPLENRFREACRRTQLWTKDLNNRYFDESNPINCGHNSLDCGYIALRNDYKDVSSIVGFSSVVVSADGNKAVCYASFACGGLCGSGNIFLLERQTSGWKVLGAVTLWTA